MGLGPEEKALIHMLKIGLEDAMLEFVVDVQVINELDGLELGFGAAGRTLVADAAEWDVRFHG